jgi:four helix bundle protein
MATFTSFEEIEAWKEARLLVKKIRAVCKRECVKRDYGFIDQISRSVRSIAANIAEGFESMTVTEFIAFLSYSKRSAGETRSHLYDALDEQYITDAEFRDMSEHTRKIAKMIAGLIHYLQSIDAKKKRTVKINASGTKNQ